MEYCEQVIALIKKEKLSTSAWELLGEAGPRSVMTKEVAEAMARPILEYLVSEEGKSKPLVYISVENKDNKELVADVFRDTLKEIRELQRIKAVQQQGKRVTFAELPEKEEQEQNPGGEDTQDIDGEVFDTQPVHSIGVPHIQWGMTLTNILKGQEEWDPEWGEQTAENAVKSKMEDMLLLLQVLGSREPARPPLKKPIPWMRKSKDRKSTRLNSSHSSVSRMPSSA